MHARRIAVSLALASFAAYGQALLDDATIEKLVKAGVGDQAVVALVNQQPGRYALSSDDILALKTAGISDKILAAMATRKETANGSAATSAGTVPAATNQSPTPAVLVVQDATPIRLRLTNGLIFTSVKPGDRADFDILDDLRIDGILVMARGARATATMTMAEPKTRTGRGGKLGVNLDCVPLLNGDKAAIRAAKDGHRAEQSNGAPAAIGDVVRPAAPSLLFTFGREEAFPEGTVITAYVDGEIKLDPARFLIDVAFTSSPQGALVSMYGASIGQTPFTTKLAAGKYKAVFSADGYPDLTQSISVGPGQSSTVHAVFELKP